MKKLTPSEITEAVLNGGIKTKLWGEYGLLKGKFSAPFDEATENNPVYKSYDKLRISFFQVGSSEIEELTIPHGVTYMTPIGDIEITEGGEISWVDIKPEDKRPPEVVAAEMIKNIYLATFAPEHLPASWRAE